MIFRRTVDEFRVTLQTQADAVARGGIPDALRQPIAMMFLGDVREQFYQSRDENGKPWAILKYPRPQGGNKPLLDKGILANSYQASVEGDSVVVASAHVGAAVHQDGAIIRPVNAKVLAIPVSKEATRYGSPRRFPRKLFAMRGGLYERVPGKKKDKLVKHYVFADKVTIPARPVGFSDRAISQAAEMIADHYGDNLGRSAP